MFFSNFRLSFAILMNSSLECYLAFFNVSSIFFVKDWWFYSISDFMLSMMLLKDSTFLKTLVNLVLFFSNSAIFTSNLESAVLILDRKANSLSSTFVFSFWISSCLFLFSSCRSATLAKTYCLNALSSSYFMIISSYFYFCLSIAKLMLKY